MVLVSIGTFLFALAFAIVAVFFARLLSRAGNTIRTLGVTLDEVEKDLHLLSTELEQTLQETEMIADDLEQKLKATDGLFASIEHVGDSLNMIGKSLLNKTKSFSKGRSLSSVKPFIQAIQWGEIAQQLYSKWKTQRSYLH